MELHEACKSGLKANFHQQHIISPPNHQIQLQSISTVNEGP